MSGNADAQSTTESNATEHADSKAIKFVILFLGWFAILGLVAITILLSKSPSRTDLSALIALVGSTIGALGAMLAQTSTSRSPAATVQPTPIASPSASNPVVIQGAAGVAVGHAADYQATSGGTPLAVQWSVTAGQIQPDANDASKAVFTAPATAATATITAAEKSNASNKGLIQVTVA